MAFNQKDDPVALQAYVNLMTKHQANLRAFIVSLMPGSQDVDDVLQDTNAVLWQKRARFEHGTNFIAWAFKIARYEVMGQRHRTKRDGLLVFTEKLIDVLTEMEPLAQSDEEVLTALDGCLAKLSNHERDLVEARYTPGRSLTQHAASPPSRSRLPSGFAKRGHTAPPAACDFASSRTPSSPLPNNHQMVALFDENHRRS